MSDEVFAPELKRFTWGKFERFALDGSGRDWMTVLFWPEFLAMILYLILAPIRDGFIKYTYRQKQQSPSPK